MNPEAGQYIKVLFVNGTSAEGTVQSWSDEKSVLVSDNESICIIHNTLVNVLTVIIHAKYRPKRVATQEFEKLAEEPKKDKQTIQDLAELKKELNRYEREEFFGKLRTHEMTQTGSVGTYAFPNLSKKPRPIKRPSEENNGKGVRTYPGLHEMFSRKDEDNE